MSAIQRRVCWWIGVAGVLWTINAILILGGFYNILLKPGWHADLHGRWVEELLVFNRQNPYTLWEKAGETETVARNLHGEQERFGPQVGGYPPWSLISAFALVPPLRFSETRIYFGALNILALGFCAFAIKRLANNDNAAGTIIAIACICLSSNAVVLRVGQYGIILNALLLAFLLLPPGKHQLLKGLILALAHSPRLLVLDEPTSALDPLMQEILHELLRRWAGAGRTDTRLRRRP